MSAISEIARKVLEETEFVALVTQSAEGPHVVATWGDYIRALGIHDDTLLVPIGYYRQTEANLKRDDRIQLLCASRRIQGSHGPGQGCLLAGRAVVQTEGPAAARVQNQFSWARGALSVRIETCRTLL